MISAVDPQSPAFGLCRTVTTTRVGGHEPGGLGPLAADGWRRGGLPDNPLQSPDSPDFPRFPGLDWIVGAFTARRRSRGQTRTHDLPTRQRPYTLEHYE